MKKILLTLPERLFNTLEQERKTLEINRNELIRLIVRQYFNQSLSRPIKKTVVEKPIDDSKNSDYPF